VRIAVVIVSLAAIAVGLVNIRRAEISLRHETCTLKAREEHLQGKYRSQDIDFGYLTAPAEVKRRGDEQGLQVTDRDKARYCVADGQAKDEEK